MMNLQETRKLAQEYPDRNCTAKFSLTAGALMRGPAKRTLKELEFYHDVEVNILEHKGLIDSDLHIRVEGPAAKVHTVCAKFFRAVERWNEPGPDEVQNEPDDCEIAAMGVAMLVVCAVIAIAIGIVVIF